MWISGEHRTVGSSAEVIRGLGPRARPLVRGEKVTDLPGLRPADGDALDGLVHLTEAARLSGGRVQRLLRVDTWLEAQDDEP